MKDSAPAPPQPRNLSVAWRECLLNRMPVMAVFGAAAGGRGGGVHEHGVGFGVGFEVGAAAALSAAAPTNGISPPGTTRCTEPVTVAQSVGWETLAS